MTFSSQSHDGRTTSSKWLGFLVASEQHRIQQLLGAEKLGGRRPTPFLRHLQQRLVHKPASLGSMSLRKLFLERLRVTVVMGLTAAQPLPLSELAALADRMVKVASFPINNTPLGTTDNRLAELHAGRSSLAASPGSSPELSITLFHCGISQPHLHLLLSGFSGLVNFCS